MKAAIYLRTNRHDKSHVAISLDKQETHTRELASKHGLTVAFEHVYSDIDYPGDAPPSSWVFDDDDRVTTRPALSAMLTAIEDGAVQFVIVRKMERLGTASSILEGLRDCFLQHQVKIIATPENTGNSEDPIENFAIKILHPCIQYDTREEQERKTRLRARKIEEIERLKDKITRLEAEVAELQS